MFPKIEVILIAALSADGFIAADEQHLSTSWTSDDDRKHLVAETKKAGVVIMGANTFRTFNKPLKGRLNVIYSRSHVFENDFPGNDQVLTTSQSPADLLDTLKEKGYTSVALCGGTSIYSMFLQSGLVTRFKITIEPVLLGNGLSLFQADLPKIPRLKLEKHEVLPTGTIFLEYTVDQATA